MRIGFVVTHFSPLSESFVRREVLALCELGHRVFVYADCLYYEPQAKVPSHPNLTIRQVPFLRSQNALSRTVFEDGIDHLNGSLMAAAHRAAFVTARELQTLFTLRVYSGVDIFTRRDPDLYREAANNQLCVGIIVEDQFMLDWMKTQYGVPAAKLTMVANSFDLDTYRPAEPREAKNELVILSIARFVPKKGLQFLIEAFHEIAACHQDVELWLAGYGPEEPELRALAAGHERIRFLGAVDERETRKLYQAAAIFCLPCIRTDDGDADGIPTTVLEAMAFELPVVGTDILSTPHYLTSGHDGLLVPPKDPKALTTALDRLLRDPDLRRRMGQAARQRVTALCDINSNARRLDEIIAGGRWQSWKGKLAELEKQRSAYTPERLAYYHECRRRAVEYFQPRAGRLLDIGCWLGELKDYLPATVEYYGCDPAPPEGTARDARFAAARAERLPFPNHFFDSAVFYAVLIHVIDVDRALAEAARVLKPGGRLYLQECYNDPNPIHMNHFSADSLQARVRQCFNLVRAAPANEYLLMMVAEKPRVATIEAKANEPAVVAPKPQAQNLAADLPLVSICITTFNRAELVRQSIDSVLRQTYPHVELVVVDDGSNDDSRRVLESYDGSIRLAFNERNRGMAYTKNRALRMTSASVKYVGILDSDDYLDPRFVAACVETLERNTEAGLVYTDDIMVDHSGRELCRQPAVDPWSIDAWLRTCNLRGDTWLARRQLVMQTELHDENTEHDHDYDLFFQLLKLTTFRHLPEYLVFIRQHNGRSSNAHRLQVARDHAANLVKHGFSPEYAYLRARRNPEWIPAIEEGIAIGRKLRAARRDSAQQNLLIDSHRSNGYGSLAIRGGAPVRPSFLPFGAPCLGEEEIAEVTDTIRSGWIGTGPKVELFEQEFAAYVGAKHAISLNSCTAGLFLSLLALGIGAGDEVITTPLTFAATVNVIEHVGARPVFADIDPVTLNIDPAQVEQAITPRTRAIIPVHFGGLAIAARELQAIATRHSLPIIEDAAHALGTLYEGRSAGTLGMLGSFSFYANKNLTTGEGGMVTTDNAGLAEKIRLLSLHGLSHDAWKRFTTRRLMKSDIIMAGYKFNMSDLAAGIGIQQLRKQNRFLEIRQQHARRYDEAFACLPVRFQPRGSKDPSSRHSLHLYTLILEAGRWRASRDEVIEALLNENIGAALHYRAIHTHPFYREKYGYQPEDYGHAYKIGEHILSLPMTPGMNEGDVDDVIHAVHKVATAYAK